MDSTELGLDLIARIYQATAGLAHWQRVADGMSEALEGSGVVYSLRPPDTPRARHLFTAGSSASTGAGRADAFLDWMSRSHAARQPFARGFAVGPKELGYPSLAHIIEIENGRSIASVVVHRAQGEPEFSVEQRALANRLVPHLARAMTMSRTLLTVAQQRLALAEVVDRLPDGIILLSETGEVVFASRSAMRILTRCDGLSIIDGMLRAEDKAADRTLQEHIAEVVAPAPAAGGGAGLVAPRTSRTDAYPMAISRLLPGRSIRDAVASVIVGDPGAPTAPAVELLQSLHDLTPAEADLVSHLASGHSLEDAARARGVSINTARSQIKQVFHKTGTRRQGDLVQLVLRCFMPMARE